MFLPLAIKAGNVTDEVNYKSVSILLIIAKVAKKMLAGQLTALSPIKK